MATQNTSLAHKRTVILSVLLLTVIASGFSQIELHSHPAAQFGHVHDSHDHDGENDANFGDIDDPGSTGVMHMHDIGTPALALLPAIEVDIVAHRQAKGRTQPPTAKPPDNPITPLHRPPIV